MAGDGGMLGVLVRLRITMSDSVRVPRMSTTGTFEAVHAVELAVSDRNGFVENRHIGSAVVLNPDGDRLTSLGEPDAVVLPRSTLKPFQAIASLGAGAQLDDVQIAIATASHAGTAEHVAVVREVLARAGLSEDALLCPPALPADVDASAEVLRSGGTPAPAYMECSGKHAGMLAACVASGWSIRDYIDPQHPLQQHVKDVVERLTGEKVSHVAVDGCGAPVFAITLAGLARGVQRMAMSAQQSPFALYRTAATVYRCARENAWAISGRGRPDTVLMETIGGYAKAGADGAMTMSASDGTTVAVKVLGGSVPAARVAALGLLMSVGAVAPDTGALAMDRMGAVVTGGGAEVGRLRPVV